MSECKAVTKRLALEYRKASKVGKGQILDQVCGLNGWHRNHARKALTHALVLKPVKTWCGSPEIVERFLCCFPAGGSGLVVDWQILCRSRRGDGWCVVVWGFSNH